MSPQGPVPSADVAIVDYLSFTAPIAPEHRGLSDSSLLCAEGVDFWAASLQTYFGIQPSWMGKAKGGYIGYDVRWNIKGGALGLLAYGGKAQRGTLHVSLPGTACALVKDWAAVARFLELNGAKITRLDLAHDDAEGSDWNIEKVQALYDAGDFTSGGRPPSRKYMESDTGRTLYIGRRENGKMMRGYEKGRQLGDVLSRWFRVEVEFRSAKRVIPLDAVVRRGEYLSGAFPALATLSAIQDKIATITKIAELTYAKAVNFLTLQYGQLLNLVAHVEGGDAANVVFKCSRPGTPKRLRGLDHYLSPPPAALAA